MIEEPRDRRVVHEEIIHTPDYVEDRVVESYTHIDPTPAERQLATLYRAQQVVWFLIGLLSVLIALRFVLLALGANMAVGFGGMLYNVTQPFVAPFLPLFNDYQAAVQVSNLVAIVVYLLIGWGISRLLELVLAPRTTARY
jgi:uncharacterized protein YggT (Ycf19 family)